MRDGVYPIICTSASHKRVTSRSRGAAAGVVGAPAPNRWHGAAHAAADAVILRLSSGARRPPKPCPSGDSHVQEPVRRPQDPPHVAG